MNAMADDNEFALEYLLFRVGREEYGVDIRKVQEIRSYEVTTQIVNSPAYLKGVINLRGLVVPMVDLRIKFGQQAAQYDQQTVTVVLQLNGQMTGVVVDGVSDVAAISPAQIKPVPQLTRGENTDYILGLASVDERIVILVDMEGMLGAEGLVAIEAAAVSC